MDKLQWFKFTPSDWMMGKIQRCPEITQARFLRLACLYWNKECELSLIDAEIEIDKDHLTILIDKKVIKVEGEQVSIDFLDEQMTGILETSVKRREAVNKRWSRKKQKQTSVLQTDTSVLQTDTDKSKIRVDKNRVNTYVESIDFDLLLQSINRIGNRSFKVIGDKAKRQYKARLKEGYTKDNIKNAIINAHQSDHHKEAGFKWLTVEFFSRSTTLDQYGYEIKTTKAVNNNPVLERDDFFTE